MDALRLHDLSWHPAGAGKPVLDSIELTVGSGEVVALLGPSGAGKTSLLRLIAGLEKPTRGAVEIGGIDVTDLGVPDRPVGMVAQNSRLFPDLSVLDNVAFRLRLSPAGAGAAVERARHTLQLLGIGSLAARLPEQLSEGEQQRVVLARALAPGPALLLLDEPMSHLDPRLRRAMRREVLDLRARLGLTLVYVTHDQSEAMALSDRIALMHQGRIVQLGTPRHLYEDPGSDFVAAFMGDMRLFEGWRDGSGQVHLGPLRWPGPPRTQAPAGPVRVVVRPQAWCIGPAHTQGLPARVLRSACTGPHVEYIVRTALGEMLVLTPRTPRRHEDGAPVSLTLGSHGVAVLPQVG